MLRPATVGYAAVLLLGVRKDVCDSDESLEVALQVKLKGELVQL